MYLQNILECILHFFKEIMMRDKIQKVLEAMKDDYKDWADRCAKGEKERAINTTMYEEYCEGLEISEGSRYWKITGKS